MYVIRSYARITSYNVCYTKLLRRFLTLGARPDGVEVTGSIKFDVHLPGSLRERADVMRREWGGQRPVWLAASTHEGEDELMLQAHAAVRRRLEDALLVLVPRITSYNVCYTKLLRPQQAEGDPAGPDLV